MDKQKYTITFTAMLSDEEVRTLENTFSVGMTNAVLIEEVSDLDISMAEDKATKEPLCEVRWMGTPDIDFLVDSGCYPALEKLRDENPKEYEEFLAETENRVNWDQIGDTCCEKGNEIIMSAVNKVANEIGIEI